MTSRQSSARALVRDPSSQGLRLVGHVEQSESVTGIAKPTLSARLRVQWVSRFKAARAAIGWSQDKTGLRVGWSRRQVIKFESGTATVTEEAIDIIDWLERQAALKEVA